MSVISIDRLQVNYDQLVALKEISFEIGAREFVGIIGPNGGGKTTLIKSILGLLKPTTGKIHIHPSEVIGYVPQRTTFDRRFPITVREVILLGHLSKHIHIFRKFREHDIVHAESIMKQLGIDQLSNRQIGTLSGGQMQKVLIARALMNHPTILVLDEPMAGVDETSKNEIYIMLKDLKKKMTIIMISHDTSELWQYVDRVFYINKSIHIHENEKEEIVGGDSCPLNNFIREKNIQANFKHLKEKVNDRSYTSV